MGNVTCEGCGRSVNPSQETAYQLNTGWTKIRPSSSSLRLKRKEQRFLCHPCLSTMESSGQVWQQPQLFEEE